ncbi:MAG: hypothetical protein OXC48_08930 [Endozoicomonadaceae bacterium]|nr:hypothetical protein [Endozoicomonadaceae bacterium]
MKKLFSHIIFLYLYILLPLLLIAPGHADSIKRLSCISASVPLQHSEYVATVQIQNECDKSVDLRGAFLQFNTNKTLENGSFWGNFGNVSYPSNPKLSAKNNQATLYFNFPNESWVHSKLAAGQKISVSFSSYPGTTYTNFAFYLKTEDDKTEVPFFELKPAKKIEEKPFSDLIPAKKNEVPFSDLMPSKPVSTKTGTIYSFYKDISINMDWNSYVISTRVYKKLEPLIGQNGASSVVLPGNKIVTFAFATGTCKKHSWAQINPSLIIRNNISAFNKNKTQYIISTGGASGTFMCDSVEDMEAFIKQYQSTGFLGIDFDIEGGYNQDQLKHLMKVTAEVQKKLHFRVSLTLATLATSDAAINTLGQWALQAAQDAQLDFFVNLMTMDYGPGGCSITVNGKCDMGKAAILAAKTFAELYKIPLSRIELTPMIGQNDVRDEITSVDDVITIANFVKNNHMAGMHMWSWDRDTNGSGKYASPVHSGTNNDPLAYNRAILSVLG